MTTIIGFKSGNEALLCIDGRVTSDTQIIRDDHQKAIIKEKLIIGAAGMINQINGFFHFAEKHDLYNKMTNAENYDELNTILFEYRMAIMDDMKKVDLGTDGDGYMSFGMIIINQSGIYRYDGHGCLHRGFDLSGVHFKRRGGKAKTADLVTWDVCGSGTTVVRSGAVFYKQLLNHQKEAKSIPVDEFANILMQSAIAQDCKTGGNIRLISVKF